MCNFLALDVLIPEIATFESARKAHIYGIEIAKLGNKANKSLKLPNITNFKGP